LSVAKKFSMRCRDDTERIAVGAVAILQPVGRGARSVG